MDEKWKGKSKRLERIAGEKTQKDLISSSQREATPMGWNAAGGAKGYAPEIHEHEIIGVREGGGRLKRGKGGLKKGGGKWVIICP